MHIADGLIPLWQAGVYWMIALIFIILSLRWARSEMDEAKVPMFAVLAAGIFAIQAINIPVPWGTSGHMLGGVMAAIILGSPFAGILLLTLVLMVQGFLFADGGLSVMGANILDMGVIGTFSGYYAYRVLRGWFGMTKASFAGGWVGIFTGALAVAVQLSIAGVFPLLPAVTWMGIYHAFIGIVGEGLITAIVINSIMNARPDLLAGSGFNAVTGLETGNSGSTGHRNKNTLIAGVTIAVILAVLAPFLASSNPDGLQKNVIELIGGGDAKKAENIVSGYNKVNYKAPFSDYSIAGMGKAGKVLAIFTGTIIMVFIGISASKTLKKKKLLNEQAKEPVNKENAVAPVIEIKDLSHSYQSGKNNHLALDGVSLRISKGEKIMLLGANGSGKSTLIRHLNGILPAQTGEVCIKGEPVSKKNLHDVRRAVGIVYQNPDDQVFLPTVLQDVAFGPINLGLGQDAIDQRVQSALKNVGLAGFENRSPHHLSGGERKLVAIAGVLAMEPEVIVLDEPTAGLDPEGKLRILKLIYRLNKELGITTIIATHDVDVVPVFADRAVVLANGRKIADDTPTKVFSDPEVLKKSRLLLPIVTRLILELQEEGIPIETRFTVEGAKKELIRIMEEKCTAYPLQI